jgi:hypothetical protein
MTKTFETWLAKQASATRYPPTPNIVLTVGARLAPRPLRAWTYALALILALALAAWSIPPVRAQVLRWLQIGGVTLLLADETPSPAPPATSPPTATLSAPLNSRNNLPPNGEVTLEQARERFAYPIAYPPGAGAPQHIYLQDLGSGPFVILLWVDPLEARTATLALFILAPETQMTKGPLPAIVETTVNGQPAIWTDGLYRVAFGPHHESVYFVNDHALIWERDGLTYRLETGGTLAEAVAIAESIP